MYQVVVVVVVVVVVLLLLLMQEEGVGFGGLRGGDPSKTEREREVDLSAFFFCFICIGGIEGRGHQQALHMRLPAEMNWWKNLGDGS